MDANGLRRWQPLVVVYAALIISTRTAGAVNSGLSQAIAATSAEARQSFSYFFLGRKKHYIPLYFLAWWVCYTMYLLLQAIASRWVS